MNKKDELQAIISKLINEHGSQYGLKLESVEESDNQIDVRLKGQLLTIQIN